ncbi:MAG TPA: response regulator [Gammaproteobacteria bacterium]|nr:response regulator [Gammaproteobacteria bacterium]
MTKKKSLVVDDSKSARFALKRMLNELGLDVDTVDSAQDALDYLEENHPDVIFMDHMMPGMDGFEAVKRIKSNSQTAVIPILMYTTKGSELYLSQARALGVVGIIPKTIAPVELKASLFELGLIDNDKMESSLKLSTSRTLSESDNEPETAKTRKKNVLDIYVEDLRKLMDDQTVELHRSMWLGVESVSNEIFNRLNTELDDKIEKINSVNEKLNDPAIPVIDEKPNWPLYIVSVLLFVSVIFNVVLMKDDSAVQMQQQNTAMNRVNATAQQTAEDNTRQEQQNKLRWNFIQWALSRIIKYPYDELALNEKRAVRINEVIGKALESNYKGRIVFQSHVGEFCFTSDQSGSYNLAQSDLPVTECDFIGNYMQPDDYSTTHQSLFFVNFLSDLYALEDKGIIVDVQSLPRSVHAVNYPPQTSKVTAGEWNKAAQLNNQITIKLEPLSGDFMGTSIN